MTVNSHIFFFWPYHHLWLSKMVVMLEIALSICINMHLLVLCASKLCKSGNRQFKNAFYDKYTSESDDRLWKKIIDHQNR